MSDPSATVGIGFRVEPTDAALAEIQRIQQAMGGFTSPSANPWNPAAGVGTPPVGAPSPTSPGPTSPLGSFGGMMLAGAVIHVQTLIVQSAGTVNISGGGVTGAGGGGGGGVAPLSPSNMATPLSPNAPPAPGAPGTPGGPGGSAAPPAPGMGGGGNVFFVPPFTGGPGGYGGGAAAPPIPPTTPPNSVPSPAAPSAPGMMPLGDDTGLERFYRHLKWGATDGPDMGTWQQAQFRHWAAGGGRGSFARYLTTGAGEPSFADAAFQQAFGGLPGLGQLGSGSALAGIGEAFSLGGFGAGMGAIGTALGPAGIVGLGAFAAHTANRIGQAALSPAVGMRNVTPEQYVASMLQPLSFIPGVGMGLDRIQALDELRTTSGNTALRSLRGDNATDLEQSAAASGRNWTDDAYDWASLAYAPLGGIRSLAGDNPINSLLRGARARMEGSGIPGMRGNQVAQIREMLAQANPALSSGARDDYLSRIARSTERAPLQMTEAGAMAAVESRRLGSLSTLGGALSGRGISSREFEGLASVSAMSGDAAAIMQMQIAANAYGFHRPDLLGLANDAAAVQMAQYQGGLAGQGLGYVQGLQQRAQATMQGGAAISALISSEGDPLRGQISAIEAEMSVVEGFPDTPEKLQRLNALHLQRQQVETQLASAPFRQAELRQQSLMQVAGAAGQAAGAQLSAVSLMGRGNGAAGDAFANQRNESMLTLRAARNYERDLRAAGAGPEALEAARAQTIAAEAALGTLGARQTDTRYQLDQQVAQAATGVGQARLTGATMGDFWGDAAEMAQATVVSGLQAQLRNATARLARVLAEPGAGEGRINEARGQVEEARNAIQQAVLSGVRQAAQDALTVAQSPGIIAGAAVGAASALGVVPGAADQQAQMSSAQAVVTTARRNAAAARAAGDERSALQWDQQAAQAEASLATLPLQQMNARYAPLESYVGSVSSIAGSVLTAQRLEGMGGGETLGTQRAQVAAAQANLTVEESRLREMRSGVVPASSALITQQEARVAQARVGVGQARTSLGDVAIPVDVQEARAQSRYEANILQTIPGAYGNVRAALQNQMGATMEEIRVLEERLQSAGPEMTPTARFGLRQRLRELGMEQAQTAEQLSFGWESRVAAQAVNTPGNFQMIANVLASPMAATLSGIVNPHFGATQGTLPWLLGGAGLVSQPGMLPGQRGPFFSNAGSGVFGMGSAAPRPAVMPGSALPGRSGGGQGSGGGEGQSLGYITVQLQWPDGSQAGFFKVPAPSGNTAQGVQGGESAELGNSLPHGTPSWRN